MRFRATVEPGGKSATGIRVPEEVIAGLGAGKRPPVRVTIGAHTYRTTVAPRGGAFLLSLSAENREAAGVSAGDEVDVGIEVDDRPREVSVPADFASALDADPAARAAFDRLSYSHQLRHVLAIEGTKVAETRQRRIAKAITALCDG